MYLNEIKNNKQNAQKREEKLNLFSLSWISLIDYAEYSLANQYIQLLFIKEFFFIEYVIFSYLHKKYWKFSIQLIFNFFHLTPRFDLNTKKKYSAIWLFFNCLQLSVHLFIYSESKILGWNIKMKRNLINLNQYFSFDNQNISYDIIVWLRCLNAME